MSTLFLKKIKKFVICYITDYNIDMNKLAPPGTLIKMLYLDPLNLSVTDGADLIKIARPNFSKLINGRISITANIAYRLEAVFGTPAKKWLLLQLEYDLYKERSKKINLIRYTKKTIKVPSTLIK